MIKKKLNDLIDPHMRTHNIIETLDFAIVKHVPNCGAKLGSNEVI